MSKRLKRKSPVVPTTKPAPATGATGATARRAINRPPQPSRPRWLPFAIGGAIIVLIVAGVLLVRGQLMGAVASTPTVTVAAVQPTGTAAAVPHGTPTADASRPFDAIPPAQRNGKPASLPQMTIDPTKHYTATIQTAKGNIVIALRPDKAPQTVNNFVYLARQGYYDGLTFHRVVKQPGFEIIQGGDPTGTGTGGPAYTVPAEINLPHTAGAVAMARTSDEANPQRASSGSQFYIALVPLPSLDNQYTVFGQVVAGLDVAGQITQGDIIQRVDITQGP